MHCTSTSRKRPAYTSQRMPYQDSSLLLGRKKISLTRVYEVCSGRSKLRPYKLQGSHTSKDNENTPEVKAKVGRFSVF